MHPRENPIGLHFTYGSGLAPRPLDTTLQPLLVVGVPHQAPPAVAPTMHPELEPLVQVESEGADEGGVIPGVGGGGVAEVRHVQQPRAAAGGEENLLLVGMVAFG